ncbi:hypothetical protein RRG08_005738 [Elysia crispata]|uniref:Uncharacterized protein n=1 Tax=Elysia crispata TaxID=231223 RepID=A0AAE1CX13_9GAST|nr:hypothetical protein RRG08_005738 [Elysia crispata]
MRSCSSLGFSLKSKTFVKPAYFLLTRFWIFREDFSKCKLVSPAVNTKGSAPQLETQFCWGKITLRCPGLRLQ